MNDRSLMNASEAPPDRPVVAAQVHALLDLACAPHLSDALNALGGGAVRCLFEGRLAEPLRRVSPVIVATARVPWLLERWPREAIGRSWGVLVETPLPLDLARRHVRRFLQVKLPDGSGPLLLRFWDPRVLGPLVAAADAAWRDRLFSEVISYVVEHEGRLARLRPGSSGVVEEDGGAWLAGRVHAPAPAGRRVRTQPVASITPAQFERLSDTYTGRLEQAIAKVVRDVAQDAIRELDDRRLAALVHGACARGRGYGFDTTRQLVRFCVFEAMFGVEFEASPAFPGARAILERRELPPWARLDRLAAIAATDDGIRRGVTRGG